MQSHANYICKKTDRPENVLFEKGKDTFLCTLGLAINSKAATLKRSKKF